MRSVIGRRTGSRWGAGGLAIGAALWAVAAYGQPSPAERGERLYQVHCRSCHGDQGRGDGVMAAQLTTRPADLTRLAADGGFDAEAIRRAIDGRMAVPSHTVREMPIWGLTFELRGGGAGRPQEVEGRLDDLVAFLRSIQASETDPETP